MKTIIVNPSLTTALHDAFVANPMLGMVCMAVALGASIFLFDKVFG